jgi:hypothetical protein
MFKLLVWLVGFTAQQQNLESALFTFVAINASE